ncbi:MAG: glycosyltransferase family 39 protein [Deltaproteobacteria bacterium]|nr:glycosyltransferase family 39 protein [Deltaproteobacteria bacterium]
MPDEHSARTARDRIATPHDRSGLVDCAAIVACGAVVALALRPFQDTPFVDDWVYAWSVRRLLEGHGLATLEWSSHPNVAHVLWGALFCVPAGFSFTALRMSTWVAALLGLCGFHLLLRALGIERRGAALGTALLGLNPVFFVLSATFMTDVPFVTLAIWATLALVSAISRRDERRLAAFALFCAAATAVRVVGIVLPVAAVLALATHGGAWGRRPRRLTLAAAPLAFAALLLWWNEGRAVHVADLTWVTASPVFRRRFLVESLPRLPEFGTQTLLCAAGTLGVALLPLVAAATERRHVRCASAALAGLVVLAAGAQAAGVAWPPALAPGFVWTWGELGASESLVAGAPAPLAPPALASLATLVAFASSALALAIAWRRPRASEAFLLWSLVGHLGLAAVLWLFYDRYLLAVLPLVIPLVLLGAQSLRTGTMAAGLGALALVSVVGTRDHLAYDAALWRAVDLVRARGVPDTEIDAGYVVDGWLHFARPDQAPRDASGGRIFSWITSPGGLLPWQIANRPLPGWDVAEAVPYERWLGRSGALYALRRAPGD